MQKKFDYPSFHIGDHLLRNFDLLSLRTAGVFFYEVFFVSTHDTFGFHSYA